MKIILYCALAITCLLSNLVQAAQGTKAPDNKWEMEVLSWSPRIFVFRNFLSPLECEYFIQMAKPQLRQSAIVGLESSVIDGRRTSRGMFFPIGYSDTILERVENRISLLTFIPREFSESIQVVHYLPGQEYQQHYDFFDVETPAGKIEHDRGGQRLISFLMYLNTPEEGGETVFPLVDIAVQPRKGDALMFFDCDLYGDLDLLTLHAGAPVIKGEKWLATKWLHPRPFTFN